MPPIRNRFRPGMDIKFDRIKVQTPLDIKNRLRDEYGKDVSLSLSYSEQLRNRIYINLFADRTLIGSMTYSNTSDFCGEIVKKKLSAVDLGGDVLEMICTWIDELGHPILVRQQADQPDRSD